MTFFIIIAAGFGLAIVASRPPAWPPVIFAFILGSLSLFPKSLTHDPDPTHIGIAQSAPTIATYSAILLAATYVLLLRVLYRRRQALSLPPAVFVFLGFMAIGLSTIWHGNQEQLAGALQLTLGFCAWFVGGQLGPLILSEDRRIRWIAGAILGIIVTEAIVASLQRLGLHLNPMPPTLAKIMGDRTNGTTNHPDNLGKVLLLLLILSLGLMGTADPRARRTLWFGILLMFIPLGLSQGRADLLAALTTIVFWAILSGGRRSIAIRLGLPLAAVLIVLPFAGAVAKRLEEDPSGGPRGALAVTAVEQIHREPWGVGPNSYVSVVSAYNAVTALGYPVSNAFLLTAAELGVLGAVLYWLPVLGLLISAVLSLKRPGFRGSFALAIIASTPGLYVINETGWAMLSVFLLPFWFLIYGVAYSQFHPAAAPSPARLDAHPDARHPSPIPAGPSFTAVG